MTTFAPRSLRARDPGERHRASTPLELLTDLCFVVAVSQAAATLHHTVTDHRAGSGVLGFVFAFFAIWWTWLNFSWFASAYDNDDVVYRLLTVLQIVGSLVLAAGVPALFEHNGVAVVGYVIMRVALVAQWLRAAAGDPDRRSTCRRYALGISLVQLLWIGSIWVPSEFRLVTFIVLIAAEFAVPVLAERSARTSWHGEHIAERYALFFIIVLGEVILSTADGITEALRGEEAERLPVLEVTAGGILVVFALWWLYFSRPAARTLGRSRNPYLWGFGHYLIFSSAAAVGAGLAARIDYWTGLGPAGPGVEDAAGLPSASLLTVSVAVLSGSVWLLQLRPHDASLAVALPVLVAVLALLGATFSPVPELLAGAICAALLAVELGIAARRRLSAG